MGDLAARLAADEIAALLGLADQDRAKLDDRPVCGSDIAVLVRTAEQGRRIARALHDRHIASVEIGIESVMASREAEQLERLLWAIAKPQSPPRTRGAPDGGRLGGSMPRAVGALQDDDNAWNIWTERLGDWLEEWGAVGRGHVDPAHPRVRGGQGGRPPVALPGRARDG